MLPDEPVLMLLDELVLYMAKLTQQEVGNVVGFLRTLAIVTRHAMSACWTVGRPCRFVFFVFFVLLPHYLLRCLEVFVSDQ